METPPPHFRNLRRTNDETVQQKTRLGTVSKKLWVYVGMEKGFDGEGEGGFTTKTCLYNLTPLNPTFI